MKPIRGEDRVLRSCVDTAQALPGEVVGEAEIGGRRVSISRFMTPAPLRATTGKVEAMALYAGESVVHVHPGRRRMKWSS